MLKSKLSQLEFSVIVYAAIAGWILDDADSGGRSITNSFCFCVREPFQERLKMSDLPRL
jgi:hypothetical protein